MIGIWTKNWKINYKIENKKNYKIWKDNRVNYLPNAINLLVVLYSCREVLLLLKRLNHHLSLISQIILKYITHYQIDRGLTNAVTISLRMT